jgi:hypothetical protein
LNPIARSLFLFPCVVLPLLSGCESVPAPDTRFVMVVKAVPSNRQALQGSPGLSLALARGVTREDVSSGRLVTSGCYIRPSSGQPDPPLGRRFGYTLLPAGLTLERGATITVKAEGAQEADGSAGPFGRFFGRYVQRFKATEADFFTNEYLVGKGFWCRPVSSTGDLDVAVILPVPYWDFDFAQAEAGRHSGIRDEELAARRIAVGECATGVDSWARWTVRLPDGLDVKAGDYLEVLAGAREGSTDAGPVSTALRRVAEPPKSAFIRTQGRDTVGCAAPARPQ